MCGEQQWLRHDRSFIHNIMAAETWVSSTLLPWWTHEMFAVVASSDGSEPTIGGVCALKTNKQRRRRMVQSFYTVSTKVRFCDVFMYKSVCVAVEFLNFNEIIRHALQTNHGSAHT